MDVSSESWFSDVESEDDNSGNIGGELNSADHQLLPADGEAGTSSQQQAQKLEERRNSDEVTQKLIDLSALVPGPNEIDEVTVISNAIKYVKELRESVSLLEDQMNMEQSIPANKKAKGLSTDHEAASEDTASSHRVGKVSGYDHEIGTSDDSLPYIEARFWNKDVLVRIHCRESKGLLVDILNHLENLHLPVMHHNVLRFGDSNLDISIVAKMEEGFTMTDKELIASLRMTLFSPSI